MEFLEHIPLAQYTTFKIGGSARFFCVATTPEEALAAVQFARQKSLPLFVLGGGSNLLVSDRGFEGLVLKINVQGKEVISEDEDTVRVKIAAGENWDSVVAWSVEKGWWGLENLSHIPGSCGAIAVQNVGAYGQEASSFIVSVAVLDIKTGVLLEMKNEDCSFGYRSSIFNQAEKGRYIIFKLILSLSKAPKPILSYRDLKNSFEGKSATLQEIRNAVIAIRNTKFPFPIEAKNGNAGSFFKNVSLDSQAYSRFLNNLEKKLGGDLARAIDTKKFVESPNLIKLPAAALIEFCGLKNTTHEGVKINQNQPLVIVNDSGEAKARDVLALAGKVIQAVWEKFGVVLKVEPVLLGFTPEELENIEIKNVS